LLHEPLREIDWPMEKILIIDRDRATQKALKLLFEPEGYLVRGSLDGKKGLILFRNSKPTLVILDLELPRVPGRDVCRAIKKEIPSLPVLVLTAIADEAEKVLMFELGADDYVTKPFSARELLARVRSLIRQRHNQVSNRYINFDDVRVDLLGGRVTRAGKPVHLTRCELRLVEHLLRAGGRVVLYQELLSEPCNKQRDRVSKAVKGHIAKVRRKLERYPEKPSHFVTVHGVGYKFVR
jgi:DNA-binding response OmpR family regulator